MEKDNKIEKQINIKNFIYITIKIDIKNNAYINIKNINNINSVWKILENNFKSLGLGFFNNIIQKLNNLTLGKYIDLFNYSCWTIKNFQKNFSIIKLDKKSANFLFLYQSQS